MNEKLPDPTTRDALRVPLWLAVVVLVALLLRLPGLAESLWYDELWATRIMLPDFSSALNTALRDVHPPFYPLAMWLWIQVFGDGEVSIRMPALLAGLAGVALTYALVQPRFGRAAGLVAASLCALSPAHVWYSQEARPYALIVMLALLAVWSQDRSRRALRRSHVRLWAGVSGLAALALVFTHYYAVVYPALLAVFALLRRAPARRLLVALHGTVVAMLGAFVGLRWSLSGAPPFYGHLREFRAFEVWMLLFDWLPTGASLRGDLNIWTHGFVDLLDHPGLLLAHLVVALLFACGVWQALSDTAGDHERRIGALELVAFTLAIPSLLTLLALMGFDRIAIERSQLAAAPFFFGLVAGGLVSARSLRLRCASAAALAGVILVGQVAFRMHADQWTVYKPNPDWRALAALLATSFETSGGAGVVLTATPATVLGYYDRRFARRSGGRPDPAQGQPAFPVIEGWRRPVDLRAEDDPVFFIRNRYWLGAADALQRGLDRSPGLEVSKRSEVKGLEVLTYRRRWVSSEGSGSPPAHLRRATP